MAKAARKDNTIGDYLRAVKDPSALRDEKETAALEQKLDSATDGVERVRLRQQLLDLQRPSIEPYEQAFVSTAKIWADEHGIGARAFLEEDVPEGVLRRAGFELPRRQGRAGRVSGGVRRRSRVTVDAVRAAIPDGTFTIKALRQKSGASPAVVRKVVTEEEATGRLRNIGADPDHHGPGRAPALYRKV